jgi:hypothetical protein
MSANILKKTITCTVGGILASFLTILFVNSSITPTNSCGLSRTRSRRDAEIQKEVSKHEVIEKEKVFLNKAVRTGAVCLDGSPPAYHFRKGWLLSPE